MNIQEIKELIEAINQSEITSFSYQKDGLKLKIDKGTAVAPTAVVAAPAVSVVQPAVVQAPVAPVAAEPSKVEVATAQTNETLNGTWVNSPLVGVYYNAPAPGSAPFVTVGQSVKKGDVICIIEAMKVMNEITAEVSGTVLSIGPENESLVEYNQPLVCIG